MMVALQWIGFVFLVCGAWYFTTLPRVANCCTCAGCVSLATWAALLVPTAWGSLAVQIVVGVLSIRNIVRLSRRVA